LHFQKEHEKLDKVRKSEAEIFTNNKIEVAFNFAKGRIDPRGHLQVNT